MLSWNLSMSCFFLILVVYIYDNKFLLQDQSHLGPY